ncbi:MAG: lactate utilization protein [Actinomycetota bacterium]
MPEDFDHVRKGYMESRCEAAVKALDKNWFDARWFDNPEQVVAEVLKEIPKGSRIGAGGSVTLQEIGLLEELEARGEEVVYHRPGQDPEESMRVRKEAVTCQYFLSSANAVTLEGELVNRDGICNRLTGMMFGPETAFIIAGANKIVQDLPEAISRIRNVAAPANARRLGIDSPCVSKGKCVDCREHSNICRVTSIMHKQPMWTQVKVFLVAEQLGL